jgi:hypothetical protein
MKLVRRWRCSLLFAALPALLLQAAEAPAPEAGTAPPAEQSSPPVQAPPASGAQPPSDAKPPAGSEQEEEVSADNNLTFPVDI